MSQSFSIYIDAWENGAAIPTKFDFGKPGGEAGPFAVSDNLSPKISWENAPVDTKSFALVCVDPDVPSKADDVNQADRVVPADLPHVDFYHWVLFNIPADVNELPEGIGSECVVARGKPVGAAKIGKAGKNNYTDWFAGDPDMDGVYGNYDGPCPPWNDSIKHHYHFKLFALSVESLDLTDAVSGPELLEAIKPFILEEARYIGTYSMNPDVSA